MSRVVWHIHRWIFRINCWSNIDWSLILDRDEKNKLDQTFHSENASLLLKTVKKDLYLPFPRFPIYSINHPPQSYSWQSSPPIVTTKISNRDSRIFLSQVSTARFVSRPYQAVSPRYGSSPRRFYAMYSPANPHTRVLPTRVFVQVLPPLPEDFSPG